MDYIRFVVYQKKKLWSALWNRKTIECHELWLISRKVRKGMIEVDCRKCKNLGNDECLKYGKSADKAVDMCAKDKFKNYKKKRNIHK